MSFTNINVIQASLLSSLANGWQDPAGVKALLDQLRVSQAWQDIAAPPAPELGSSSTNSDEHEPESTTSDPSPPVASTSASASETSVASLLSQLQASSSPSPPTVPLTNPHKRHAGWSNVPSQQLRDPGPLLPGAALLSPRKKDTRAYTFQQALPHIAQLADDPDFVAAIKKVVLKLWK